MTKLAIFRAAPNRAHSKSLPAPRKRQLVCVWTREPASSRLTCRWRRADAEPATSDRPCPRRERRRSAPAAPIPRRTLRPIPFQMVGAPR
jgi:hypothetical protein